MNRKDARHAKIYKMKKLVFLFLIIGLSIRASAQDQTLEEVIQFFDNLKAEVPGPLCECIEKMEKESPEKENPFDYCIDEIMMERGVFKDFKKIFGQAHLEEQKGDSVLTKEANRLILELNDHIQASLEDCPTFVQTQNELPAEIVQVFEELAVDLPSPLCECIEREEEKTDTLQAITAFDSCMEMIMMDNSAFNELFTEKYQDIVKDNPALIDQANKLINKFNSEIYSSLFKDCPAFAKPIKEKAKPEIHKLCKESLFASYQGSIQDNEICACFTESILNEMKEDPAFLLQALSSYTIYQALSGQIYHIEDCVSENIDNMGTDDILKVSNSLLEAMKERTKSDYEEKSEAYDLDQFCECFYGKTMGTVTSKEWFEYMNGPNKKIDKIEKKCWKESKKK